MVVDSMMKKIACRFSIVLILLSPLSGYGAGFNDPTQPFFETTAKTSTGKAKSPLVLQAIYVRNNRMEAVINGVLLAKGDKIHGAIITSIQKNKVYYQKSNRSGVLSLQPKILKRSKVKG